MTLIELILQGVPGTQGVLRYPFQPGFNPWKQKGDLFRLEALVEVVASLFYPSQNQNSPLGPGKAQRAGITFEARGTTYRLTRDYIHKSLHLAQLETGTKDRFTELSKDPRFILATLARAAQVPSQRVFRTLLVARHGSAVLSNDDRPWTSVEQKLSDAEAKEIPDPQSRLLELRSELERLRFIDEQETQVDELQARVFQIDDRLRRLEEPKAELHRLLEEYEPLSVFDAPGVLTPSVLQKLQRYGKVSEQREKDFQGLDEKAKVWAEELERLPIRPMWKEPIAIAGASVGLAAFVGATFLRTWLWPLLAAFVLALGVMSWGLWLAMRRQERIRTLMQQIRSLDSERGGLEKRFEIETGPVRKLLESVHMKDADDVLETLGRREELLNRRREAEANYAAVRAEVPEEELKAEREKCTQKITEIQKRLQDLPPAAVDPNAIEKEIRHLESMLASDTVPPRYQETQPSESDDDVNRMFVLAAELFERPAGELLRQVQQGVAANLAILTEKKFQGFEVVQGKLSGFKTADGQIIPWTGIHPDSRAALLFAVQFTLWQLLAAEKPMPVFLDLISGSRYEKLCALSLRAAQHVAKQTQVVVLSA